MHNIYSTGQVARMTGQRPHRLEYAHASGHLAEPAYRFLGKRVYTEADVRRVAAHFGVALDDNLTVADGGEVRS